MKKSNWSEVLQNSAIAHLNPYLSGERPKKAIKIPKRQPLALKHIIYILGFFKIKYELEYKFLPDRKYRADIAIPEKKILIEYEGLISEKSRHTNIKGYSDDCEKYNLAQIEGYKVLRYTALNYKKFHSDLRKILELCQ